MHRPLPLLAISAFAPIISVLANRSVRYVTGPGNTGDKLVHAGALCLFRQINTRVVDELEQSDFLAWGGGGIWARFGRIATNAAAVKSNKQCGTTFPS